MREHVVAVHGSKKPVSWSSPEVIFEIGGTAVALRPTIVTRQRNPSMGGDCCVANIGLNLLTQTGGFTIDFSRLLLRVD